MPDRRSLEMRRAASRVTRARLVGLTGGVAVLAAVVALGAVLVGTFPRPVSSLDRGPSAPSAVGTSAASSQDTHEATSASAIATPAASAAASPAAPVVPPVLPLGMATTLPGSAQMIVATGAKLGATHGTLRIYNLEGVAWTQVLSAACRFGTNGLIEGSKRVMGDRATPTGIWWPGGWVWGWPASAPPGTLMPYRQTTANVWWSDENNATYNTWVVSSRHVGGEHLVDATVQYEFALSTGYNAPPNEVVRGRGSGIFLHVFDPPDYHNGLTAGCVAVSRADMVSVFRTINPALKPSFAIGTEAAGAGSIASY